MSRWRTQRRWRRIRTAILALAFCLLLAGNVAFAIDWVMRGRAETPSPTPIENGTENLSQADELDNAANSGMADDSALAGSSDEEAFPVIDWNYWLSINPDIVGWVSIPGTEVSYPIVMPPVMQPSFYLDHDIYGKPNRYGAIYLDDECREDGLMGGRNAVVSGHHMSNGSMFAALADYANEDFARNHSTILLQTPQKKIALSVAKVSVVPGGSAIKQTTFVSDADFERWWHSIAPSVDTPERVWTFCTCSYHFWDDERTLVYAVEKGTL